MADLFDPATLTFYEKESAAYVSRHRQGGGEYLSGFLARLRPGARVLELGCGGGQDAATMLAAGFDVDATDGTPALVATATARLGRPVRLMRYDQLDSESVYDGVWASACLLHVPSTGLPAVLARVHRAMKPGGVHFASYKATGQEGRDRLGRWYNQLTTAELLAAYRGAGDWDVLSVDERTAGGYDGVEVPWVGLTLRRVARGPTPA
jgi:2-polyprenyl-3-methyl-5-hydroxy-6-metoxy-1,4-benzoquinol methylase